MEWEEGRSFTIDGKTVLPMKFATVGALLDKLVLRREFRKAFDTGSRRPQVPRRDRRGGRHQASRRRSQRSVRCLSSPGTARGLSPTLGLTPRLPAFQDAEGKRKKEERHV